VIPAAELLKALCTNGKGSYLTYAMKSHDGLLHKIVKGRMTGKSTTGRRRVQMLHDQSKDDCSVALKQVAEVRKGWRKGKWC